MQGAAASTRPDPGPEMEQLYGGRKKFEAPRRPWASARTARPMPPAASISTASAVNGNRSYAAEPSLTVGQPNCPRALATDGFLDPLYRQKCCLEISCREQNLSSRLDQEARARLPRPLSGGRYIAFFAGDSAR